MSTANPPHRELAVPRLVLAGLGAQLLGVAVQAAFHMTGRGSIPILTETRTSLIDHVVSNLGVACLVWQAVRWGRARATWSCPARRVMVVGTCLEAGGAVADGVAHLAGGEQPAAFAVIGVGYLVVVVGAVLAWRSTGHRRPLANSKEPLNRPDPSSGC